MGRIEEAAIGFPDDCPVCGSKDSKHRWEDHGFHVASRDPLAIVVNLQQIFNNSQGKARHLAEVAAAIKKRWPEKKLAWQPSRLMMVKKDGYTIEEAHVADYIAFET